MSVSWEQRSHSHSHDTYLQVTSEKLQQKLSRQQARLQQLQAARHAAQFDVELFIPLLQGQIETEPPNLFGYDMSHALLITKDRVSGSRLNGTRYNHTCLVAIQDCHKPRRQWGCCHSTPHQCVWGKSLHGNLCRRNQRICNVHGVTAPADRPPCFVSYNVSHRLT